MKSVTLDLTTEVPCPIPDCGSFVYAPSDSHNVRIDCLDCGAALLTRRGIDGVVTLKVTDDLEDLGAPSPPLAAGRHIVAFDATEPSDDLFLIGGSKEDTHAYPVITHRAHP